MKPSWLMIGLLSLSMIAAPVRGAPLTEREKRAVALVKEAVGLQRQGQHARAVEILDEAWTVDPHPKVLFYKGRSLMQLERFEEARSLYQMIKRSARDLEPAKLVEVRDHLARCEAMLKETRVRVVTPGAPPGARVLLDDRELGRAPLEVDLARGAYALRVEHEGFEPDTRPLRVEGQDELMVRVSLKALAVRVTKRPDPAAGGSAARRPRDRTWAWIAMGAGAAALTGGGVFLGNNLYYETRSLRANQHLEGQGVDWAVGGVLTGLGAVLITTGIVLFVQEPLPSVAQTLRSPSEPPSELPVGQAFQHEPTTDRRWIGGRL
jgi:hypothetical protein